MMKTDKSMVHQAFSRKLIRVMKVMDPWNKPVERGSRGNTWISIDELFEAQTVERASGSLHCHICTAAGAWILWLKGNNANDVGTVCRFQLTKMMAGDGRSTQLDEVIKSEWSE